MILSFTVFLLMIDSGEHECYKEAMPVETRKKWEQGTNEEMESLVRKQNWDLVELLVKENCKINGFTG